MESGCTAAWLFAGLQRHGWPVICIDARHAAAALQAGFRNKNDRNDARGIADLMRGNKYRPVWVKSPEAQRHGRLLTARATLQSQLVALENTIRGLLRQEGIGLTDKRSAFEAAVREPQHIIKTGKTPVLEGTEWRTLLKSIPNTTFRDLRDRALIATLTYFFARVSAA